MPKISADTVHAPIPAPKSLGERDLEMISKAAPIMMLFGGAVGVMPVFIGSTLGAKEYLNLSFCTIIMVTALILIRKRVRFDQRVLATIAFFGGIALSASLYKDIFSASGPDAALATYAPFSLWMVTVGAYFMSARYAIGVSGVALASVLVPNVVSGNPAHFPGLLVFTATVFVIGAVVIRARALVNTLVAELERTARTDHLTGLPNRLVYEEEVRHELQRALRTSSSLSVMTMDIDHFKRINDQFGHQAGDEVLILLGALIREEMREMDLPARVGGEEFAVILLDTPLDGAMNAAERLRARIEEHFIDHEVVATVSIGVATCPDNGVTLAELKTASDGALYEAKSTGRNRVVAARSTSESVDGEGDGDGLSISDENDDLRQITPLFDIASNIRALVSGDQMAPRKSRRVAEVAGGIAFELGWSGVQCERIRIAGQLHDLGKVGVPLEILLKPEALQESEWEKIRQHPIIASHMLEKHKLHDVGQWILAQHERFDGRGYPYGLRGEEIPEGARILSVAQTFVAMTTNRLYRPPLTAVQARQEITSCTGSQFDPIVVGAFVRWLWKHRAEWPTAA